MPRCRSISVLIVSIVTLGSASVTSSGSVPVVIVSIVTPLSVVVSSLYHSVAFRTSYIFVIFFDIEPERFDCYTGFEICRIIDSILNAVYA